MREVYFKNLLDLGDLYFVKSGFEFEKEPISFLCKDKHNRLYLMHKIEIRYIGEYLITPISRWNAFKLFHNRISIYDAFNKCKSLYYANTKDVYLKLPEGDWETYIERFIPDELLEYPDFIGW